MRRREFAGILGLIGLCFLGGTFRAPAQTVKLNVTAADTETQITADSPPYRIEWKGNTGVFIRKAFAQEPEQRMPLVFVHTDAGPTGYAKHLAWFLARDTKGFSLLWCYLNDTGKDFACWLYRYPSNQLTSLRFVGNYHYTPLPEPPAAVPMNDFNIRDVPQYNGPKFTYRDWTNQGGLLQQLDLRLPKQPDTTSVPTSDTSAPVKTIAQMNVRPLHEVEVGAANGWREGGWNELHAIAFDAANNPYYLILYSNTSHGYALDLKNALVYTADYASRVRFGDDRPDFGPKDNPLNIEPDIKIHRYERDEIILTSKQTFTNPYVDAQVGIEFRSPNGKTITVPGFWDGGNTWRVRFTPTTTGIWSWRSLSKTADMSGQIGEFECINEDPAEKGFVNVQPNFQDTHHFSYANGEPFLPALLREPSPQFVALSAAALSSGAGRASQVRLAGMEGQAAPDSTAAFVQYQKLVNACAQKGFNRFVGGALLGPAASKTMRANEGGTLFVNGDPDRVNPAFFQWMDRHIAYCNARGIIPDIGLGELNDALFTTYKPESLFRLWGYVTARYAAYDVNWTLFTVSDSTVSPAARKSADEFAQLTQLYDPNQHPITVIAPGPTAPAAPPTPAAGNNSDFDSFISQFNGDANDAPPQFPPRRPGGNQNTKPKAPVVTPPPPFQDFAGWQDVISLQGGDISALPSYWQVSKPIVVMERPAEGSSGMTPEIARARMWETRMRGDYWVGGMSPSLSDPNALDNPELRGAAACADFFRQTRFSRLSPHQEMLGGPEESPADRKRRKRAEMAEALRKARTAEAADDAPDTDENSPPESPDKKQGGPPEVKSPPVAPGLGASQTPAPGPASPIFVLADPAREYVIYFEQGGSILLDLLEATGRVSVTWFNPRTGEFSPTKKILGGAYTNFTAPDNKDWVLHLSRR